MYVKGFVKVINFQIQKKVNKHMIGTFSIVLKATIGPLSLAVTL